MTECNTDPSVSQQFESVDLTKEENECVDQSPHKEESISNEGVIDAVNSGSPPHFNTCDSLDCNESVGDVSHLQSTETDLVLSANVQPSISNSASTSNSACPSVEETEISVKMGVKLSDEEVLNSPQGDSPKPNGRTSPCETVETQDLHVTELEGLVTNLRKELSYTNAKLESQDASARRAIANLQSELRLKVEQLGRALDEMKRDKESMVLKFAQSEQRCLEAQKRMRECDGRLREAAKEREALITRGKQIKQEKDRLQNQLSSKCTDYVSFEREINGLKEAVQSGELKVKWHQNKLKDETDKHKETLKKLEETTKVLNVAREESATIRRNCQDIVKTYQESDEIRSNSLDTKLRQTVEELRVQRHECAEHQEFQQKLTREVEALRRQLKEAGSEIKSLKEQLKCREAERLCHEEATNKFKEAIRKLKARNEHLTERVKQLEPLEPQMGNLRETNNELAKEREELSECRRELEAEAEAAQRKETELLEFTQRISDRNAALQSENLAARSKIEALEREKLELKKKADRVETELDGLTARSKETERTWAKEKTSLKSQLHEKTQSEQRLQQELEDEKDIIHTLKKRHVANVKDLTRQLAHTKKKLDACTTNTTVSTLTGGSGGGTDSLSQGSRTSSTGSLEIVYAHQVPPAHQLNATCDPEEHRYQPEIKMVEPDRQALIEKIVRLQKSNARLSEKIDFLQEHSRQLTDELKKKNKLVQAFVVREESGSVAPEFSDANKSMMARKGGIMASVYSSHASDGAMTLELSLEINRKLQAVLEDTLLKNITLKENISTLGEDISRLHRENLRLGERLKTHTTS